MRAKVTVYIRQEDEAKWKAIENKPEWLHSHLCLTKIVTPEEVNPKGSSWMGFETFDTTISIPTVQEAHLTPPEDVA